MVILVIGTLVVSLLAGMVVLHDDRVKIAFSEKCNYEALIIADELGMLEEAGFRSKIVTGGILAAEALVTGSADMAVMGDGPAVQVITKDNGAMIVARFCGAEGMHRFIANTSIEAPKDLEGKKVGLQQSSSTHGAFLRWAEAEGVDISKVNIVNMNPMEIPMAMKSGELDAMAGSEPWAIKTEKLCGNDVYEIGNSSGQDSTFPIVLLASQRIIQNNPDAVREMVKILERSNQYINENWNDAMAICASRTGLSDDEQNRCSSLQFFEVGFNETDEKSIRVAAEMLLEFNMILAVPDVMSRVDLSFLPER